MRPAPDSARPSCCSRSSPPSSWPTAATRTTSACSRPRRSWWRRSPPGARYSSSAGWPPASASRSAPTRTASPCRVRSRSAPSWRPPRSPPFPVPSRPAALAGGRGARRPSVTGGPPPRLLRRRGEVIPLDPPASAPPLGFMPVVRPRVERLEPGDRLLLYTDGLAEARRDGEFFPTAERAWRLLGHGTVGDGLASLESPLGEWVHGRLDADIALVLMEYARAQPGYGGP